MNSHIKYVFFFFLIILFVLIFAISIHIKKKKTDKYFVKIKKEIDITQKLILISRRYENNHQQFEKYNNLKIYMCQAESIVTYNPFLIDTIQISKLNDVENETLGLLNKDDFFREYNQASKEVKSLINDLSAVLEQIYSMNYPVKYRYDQVRHIHTRIKKNMQLQILEKIILLLDILGIADAENTKKKVSEKHDFKLLFAKN